MEDETVNTFIPIEWNPDRYGGYSKCTDGSHLLTFAFASVFENDIQLSIRERNNSTSKKSKKNGMDRKITLELSIIDPLLNATSLFIQGMLNFFDLKSKQHIICKYFKHLFKKGEETFYCDIDVSKISSEMWPEGQRIRKNIHGYIRVNIPCEKTDQYLSQCCPNPEVHKLCNDFQYLQFKKNHLTDITLKCFDVNMFAHRIILASRSTVFKAMLKNSTKEYQSGEILITDVQPGTLKKLLKYIYCAQIDELSEDSALELLYAADKYGLEELKKTCVEYLKNEISNANVFRILNAALHDEDLKFYAYEHIGKHFTEIEKSEDWKNLKMKNSALVYDILVHSVKFNYKL